MNQRKQALHEYLGKMVHVIVDRPMGYIHGDIVYPVNYGYIPGVIAGDGEEQDAYILGVDTALETFDGVVIGIVCRLNDVEDKLIVAPADYVLHQGQLAEAVSFQEQYFQTKIISIFEKSCGVLPYRVVGNKREYLLVFEQYSQCWSLPKGHMEMGESESQTALRELWEETGLTATLDLTKSASITYAISPVASKEVVFFLGRVDGEPVLPQTEIGAYRWVEASALKDYLFPDTVEACQKLICNG